MRRANNLVDRLSQAARPTLFDAVCQPELMISLILANLMSPSLWDFRSRIQQRVESWGQTTADEFIESNIMREIHSYVDKHLFHLSPLDMTQLWGVLDLQQERDRLGADVVDYAVDSIVNNLQYCRKIGLLKDNENIMPLIDDGGFPEYEYSTIDIIRAHRRHLKQKKHKPLGISSCADEAILIASLTTVLKGVSFADLVIIGAPVHYTTLIQHSGAAYWFNGKQEYFDQQGWAQLVADSGGLTVQEAFDRRADFDRLITPLGTLLLRERCSTIPEQVLQGTLQQINDFFGEPLQPLLQVPVENIYYAANPLDSDFLSKLDQLNSADSVYHYLRRQAADMPDTYLEAAFYSFRDISVRHPEAYLAAALRGHKSQKLAADCWCVDDALAIARGINGSESIFKDRNRLSMPDEVILFDTGTDRDKAFLVFTLIQLAKAMADSIRHDCELFFTEHDSYIRVAQDWYSINAWERVGTPQAPSIFGIGGSRA
ncbi:MAG: hypothetical protein GY850_10790 [bacterium]|nr:hypothetical protein [bacterium]